MSDTDNNQKKEPIVLRVNIVYQPGSKVWILDLGKIVEKEIDELKITYNKDFEIQIKYGIVTRGSLIERLFSGNTEYFNEKDVFATAEALIESLRTELAERQKEE